MATKDNAKLETIIKEEVISTLKFFLFNFVTLFFQQLENIFTSAALNENLSISMNGIEIIRGNWICHFFVSFYTPFNFGVVQRRLVSSLNTFTGHIGGIVGMTIMDDDESFSEVIDGLNDNHLKDDTYDQIITIGISAAAILLVFLSAIVLGVYYYR